MERKVLREREVEHQPAALAVLRYVPEPGVEDLVGAVVRHVAPLDDDSAGGGPPQAGDRVDQLGLAVSVHSRDADDLARANGARHSANGLQAAGVGHMDVLELEERRSPGSLGGLSTRSSTSRPTIIFASPSRVAPSRGTVPTACAAPQDGDPVGDLQYLTELVRDEDDRHPLPAEVLEDAEQLQRPPGA